MPVTRESLIVETRQNMAGAIASRNGSAIRQAADLLNRLGNDRFTEQDDIAVKLLAELDAVPTALYRHYSKDNELLYIGVSMTITGRTAKHETTAPWFQQIDHIKLQWYGSRSSALIAEEQAIKSEKPTHNITHNRRDSRARSQEPATGTLLPTG